MNDVGEPVREPDRPARDESAAADGGSGEPARSRTAGEPELVHAVQRGDEAAFGRLVDRYLDRAHAVALGILGDPHDAEDAVQDAFIRALERIDQLSPGSPFGPWFYRVLRSTALNVRRHEKLRSHEAIPLDAATSSDPEVETLRRIDRETVLRALEHLPEMQRTAVTLYDLEGYSHQEIADILGIAPGTSRAHVHHGRRALQRLLEPEEGEDR
ncbi:MAG: RNA polymerase sigma factor [Candidatus Palauibacterales bacterium]|nr:RNA polymerase sigma factor [Candidatus Palauibacterales bacterium]MDP2529674.1 RNA polymerase sigma factor [Candidatus Palauibacterales bacterium]